MRLGAFEVKEPLPELREPHALVMLRPWIDVGSVGTLTLSWLETHFAAKEVAKLARPGDFFDFTRYRPTSYYVEGQRRIAIPNAFVSYAGEQKENDFLFLRLLEPHSHGEIYVDSVVELLARFGVKRYVLLGSMYDLVPHTRPLLVTGGGVGEKVEKELKRVGIESGSYQGPTTIMVLISQRAPSMGMETMSLMVHLPQYTQLEDDYMGAVRLMSMLSLLYNLPVDETYVDKAKQQLEQLNQAVVKNPQLKAIVDQLESHYETRAQENEEKKETSQLSPEVEKFLREMERRFSEG